MAVIKCRGSRGYKLENKQSPWQRTTGQIIFSWNRLRNILVSSSVDWYLLLLLLSAMLQQVTQKNKRQTSCKVHVHYGTTYLAITSYFAHQFLFGMSQKSPQASSQTFVAHLHYVLIKVWHFHHSFPMKYPKVCA